MDGLLALGSGAVMVSYFVGVLPGDLLLMALAVLGLPLTLRQARPSPLGRLPHRIGCFIAALCAGGVALHLWLRAGEIADFRLAALVYALAVLSALSALTLFPVQEVRQPKGHARPDVHER